MKYLLIFILFLSCIQGSPLTTKKQLIGVWEMTEYSLDGVIIDNEDAFVNTNMEIKYLGLSEDEPFAFRNKNPCNQPFPVSFYLAGGETHIYFSEGTTCDTLNKIDPYFYDSPSSPRNGISGEWEFEYFNKRMFAIHNKNQSKKNTIRIIFEKSK